MLPAKTPERPDERSLIPDHRRPPRSYRFPEPKRDST